MRTIGVAGLDAPRRAAAEARRLRASGIGTELRWVSSPADERLPAAERSFVTACGRLLRSDAFWLEWAGGVPLLSPVAERAETLILVARDPADLPPDTEAPSARPVPTDAYGRPVPLPQNAPVRRVAILGRRSEQAAVLAALGDAADRLGTAVQPVFFEDRMPDADALILPGGADMAPVEPQIAAARAAIDTDLPLFGLCLGMQCLATALLRQAWPGTTLEEVAGPGPRRSFVRSHEAAGAPAHRLGDRRFDPAPGSRLAELLPAGATVRMNHRFRLAPDAPMPANVRLHGSADGPVDAIELTGRRFCLGLQGHPEIGCDAALHPLWDEFLRAALKGPRPSGPAAPP